jgi:hypothetical protein
VAPELIVHHTNPSVATLPLASAAERQYRCTDKRSSVDRDEAQNVLTVALSEYRRRSYEDLRDAVGTIETHEVRGPSGVEYQIEVDISWDSPGKQGTIRVAALIDDGHILSGLRPVCIDFLVSPVDAA